MVRLEDRVGWGQRSHPQGYWDALGRFFLIFGLQLDSCYREGWGITCMQYGGMLHGVRYDKRMRGQGQRIGRSAEIRYE